MAYLTRGVRVSKLGQIGHRSRLMLDIDNNRPNGELKPQLYVRISKVKVSNHTCRHQPLTVLT